jgi:two-component system sensor histidine kinase/response regulator
MAPARETLRPGVLGRRTAATSNGRSALDDDAAQMAAAFAAAPVGALVLSDDGRCLRANRAAGMLLARTPEQLVGSLAPTFLPPEVLRMIAAGDPLATRDHGSIGQCEIGRSDGSRVTVEFEASADPGTGCGFLFLHDITERVAAAALAERQHRQLVEAQDAGGFGHWEWDVVADRVVWSDELHRLFGLEPGAVTSFDDVVRSIHPDDRVKTRSAVERAAEDGDHFAHQFRVVRPDGVVRLFDSRGAMARADDGTLLRLFGTAQDITDRLEVESEIRNYSTILDGSDDAISALSPEGRFVSWNRGAEKVYGYSAQEAIGQSVDLIFRPAERGVEDRPWRRVLAGERVPPFEGPRIGKDGREVIVDTRLSPITDASGEIVGVAAISRDVTAHRRSEAALAEAHAKALAASRLKTEFMANMNHELRTPLNGVLGVSTLLRDTQLDDLQFEYVEALRVSGAGLMAVIEDILDFSKIEAGKLDLGDEPFTPRAVVEDVCSVVAVGQPNRAVEVIGYVDSSVPDCVYGDAARVRQVLTNLANNAVKFTEVGEVAVHVSGAVDERGMVEMRFEVVDTGIGIDVAAQDAIFESFAQADGSTTRRYGGTGLGLTIAKQLVDLMGGEIGVHSVPGQGSTFWFTLPAHVAASEAPRPPSPTLRGVHALVVDDKATNHQILTRQLSRWGLTVDTCSDGASGLSALTAAAASERPYDLALIDFKMPGALSGGELVKLAAAEPSLAPVKLVLMVASRDAHPVREMAGLHGLVTKPLREADLHDELVRVLAGRARTTPVASAAAERPVFGAGTRRVLVAEDNPVNQLVAVRLLEQRGLEVDVATNGREAVEMHERTPYDAIFMDCQMPDLDGYDATREIRRREGEDRHTPVIAMTASTMPGDTERCLAAGMDYYSGKPINPSRLDYVLGLALGSPSAPPAGDSAPAAASSAAGRKPGVEVAGDDPLVMDAGGVRGR